VGEGAGRWLVIAEEDVLPATTGCRVDHRGFLDALVAAGTLTTLLVPSREGVDPVRYGKELPGVRVVALPRDERARHHLSVRPYVIGSRPLTDDLWRAVAADEGDGGYAAVVSYSVRVAHLGRAVAEPRGLPHLVRCQNLDSAYFADLARSSHGARRAGYVLESLRLRRFERELNADRAITAFADTSVDEAAGHRTRTATPVLHIPSYALAGVGTAAPLTGRSGVVFVGSLDVETNQAAVGWLVREVWPLLGVPGAALTVVGRRPGADLHALLDGRPGLSLHGDVPDTVPYLERAAVCTNPARTGSGINVKLLQGMAAGCAAVSTTLGASGLGWVDGEHLLVRDDPRDFAAAVRGLLTDAPARARLAAAGQAYVREQMDGAANLRRMADALGVRLVAA